MRGIISIAAAIVLFAPTGAASAAESVITGTATGRTIPTGASTYRIAGTWHDASGVTGTYNGTYHTVPVSDFGGAQYPAGGTADDFTSCPFLSIGIVACIPPPVLEEAGDPYPYRNFRCNLIAGSVTLRSPGKTVTLDIGVGDVFSPRFHASVCRSLADPAIHETFLEMSRIVDSFPIGTYEFSRGYGPLAIAEGRLSGTSVPLGGIYTDTFDLALRLG